MKENFQNESKNKWTQIFKKKGFFPAVYLLLAALLVTGVIWFQTVEKRLTEGLEQPDQADSYMPNLFEEDVTSVMGQKEIIKMPTAEELKTEIVTKFYNFEDTLEVKEQALNLYNKKYYQSKGIDIVSDDEETFDVVASLSGKVIQAKKDPLRGNFVVLLHDEEITTYYSSLESIDVKVGDTIKQGEKLGNAGQNIFAQDKGIHVHFEIKKDEQMVDPEKYFNESVTKLEALGDERAEFGQENAALSNDDDQDDDDQDDDQDDEGDEDDEDEDETE